MRRQAQKAAIDPTFHDPGFDFRVIAEQQFIIYMGIILLKRTDDVGQPVRCHAGERADADQAGLQAVQFLHLHLQLAVFLADALRIRQERETVRREANASPPAFKQGDAPLVFQIADHAADTGLRIGKHLGSLGKASAFHGSDQCEIFLNIPIHMPCPILCI